MPHCVLQYCVVGLDLVDKQQLACRYEAGSASSHALHSARNCCCCSEVHAAMYAECARKMKLLGLKRRCAKDVATRATKVRVRAGPHVHARPVRPCGCPSAQAVFPDEASELVSGVFDECFQYRMSLEEPDR